MATLFPGQSLHPGQSLQSDNHLHALTMQPDGNVVLYDRNNHPLWATNTGGLITPREFIMQTDGNLVLYCTSGQARWASRTWNNSGAFLNVQDDGNLVVYRAGSGSETAENALWAAASNDMSPGGRPAGNPPAPAPQGRAEEILAAHNRYRAEVGVAPLRWSDSLAASAQQWADHLASTGTFEHSGAGENLAQASSGSRSAAQLVDMWGDEKRNYQGGTFPNVSSTGNWADVGHYTQLIWRDTSEVGGGISTGNGNDVLVCHYNPAGNMVGRSAV